MCGICGFVGFRDEALLRGMIGRLYHRGPDDEGLYLGRQAGLGHRRLSIIDLQTGQQPIFNEDKTLCIVLNGEIYNYKELKARLEKRGHVFRTKTDTEVIVHAYEDVGEKCVEELNGEFAFAIWDEKQQRLCLARDRLGIRPLYYCQVGRELIFGSELKPLLLWDKMPRILNRIALDCYLTLRYVPASMTLFEGIVKVPPGSTLLFEDGRLLTRRYWQARPAAKSGGSLRECEDAFYELLQDSVRMRLMSDVPLGAYLSGGVDSAAIVGMMSKMMSAPVKTFTIGGFGGENDEFEKAQRTAAYFHTEHRELMVGKQDFDLLPAILRHMDSPIGDAIIIPTYLLARETAKHVKVVLSGEGADEILGGYVHHLTLKYGDLYRRAVPAPLKAVASQAIRLAPVPLLNRCFPYPAALGAKGKERLANYLDALSRGSPAEGFLVLASLYTGRERDEIYADGFHLSLDDRQFLRRRMDSALAGPDGLLNNLILYDLENWLPDNTLIKHDHLAMANSLEVRVPFLDHRLVEFCAGLPEKFKIKGLTQKYLFRRAASRLLPPDAAKAPKRAFYIPIERCFGEDFDQYATEILNSERFRTRGIYDADRIKAKFARVRSAEMVDNKQLMALLILEIWFRTFWDNDGLTGK